MGGGGSRTRIHVDSRIWPKGYTHENYVENFSKRKNALVSYEPDEYLSFGQLNINSFKEIFNDEFTFVSKSNGFIDAYRNKYTNNIETCCLTDKIFFIDGNNKINTCDTSTHTFNSTLCDDILYKNCLPNMKNFKCEAWIRSVIERKSKHFKYILKYIEEEDNRNNEIAKIALEALYDFKADTNDYENIIIDTLNSYSEDIKKSEYKCAFSNQNILETEKKINVFKECWYKECVLSPRYKLLPENINKRKTCKIKICDINVNNVNITNNDIEITCLNTYNKNINIKELAINIDKDIYFYIPTYSTTLMPILILLSFLCIKI